MNLIQISKLYEKDKNSLVDYENTIKTLYNHSNQKAHRILLYASNNYISFIRKLMNKKYKFNSSILHEKSDIKILSEYKIYNFKAYYKYTLRSKFANTEYKYPINRKLSLRNIHKCIEPKVGSLGTVIITRK